MNIAFFTDTYKPNVDGVVICIELLKKELERKGHKVYVFAPSPTMERRMDNEVFYFESHPFLPYPQYRIAMVHDATLGIDKLARICRLLKIDAIHSHGIAFTSIAAYRVAKRLGIPKIIMFHTNVAGATHYISKFRIMEKGFERITWRYLKWLYSNYDEVLAPSKRAHDMLKEQGISSTVFPNGIEIGDYLKIKRKPNRKGVMLLHVGRVVKEKRIDIAMEMIKNRKDVSLDVVGKGPGLEYYRSLAKEMGIEKKVKFLGYVGHKKLNDYYRRANALVFCSAFDTQGLVVVEALASGMPVIAMAGTSGAEIAKDVNKKLVFSNQGEFDMAVSYAKRHGNCRRCREVSRKYDVKEQARKLIEKYKRK
ncbi:MAG: glycosyltransferase [Candidatus Micrarchaeota archaeon]|nr:glycosyltransferase [Candidatus Micrarchaeota archaeon]